MDWGYVAGYFDGEGSAKVYKGNRVPTIRFHNTDRGSLEAIRYFLGAGKIYTEPREGKKTCHALTIRRAADIRRIVPPLVQHCLIKRAALEQILVYVNRERLPRPKKTHCIHGHEYTAANTCVVRYRPTGTGKQYTQRQCLTCARERMRKRYACQRLQRQQLASTVTHGSPLDA